MAVAGEASGGRLRNSLFPSIVERGSQRRGAVTGAPVVGRGEAQPLTASTDAKQSRPEGKRPHLSYAPTKMSEFPNFLNAYLASKGASTVNLEQFRTLPGSTATGSTGALRLTNLMQLTVDTSWWTRYRDSGHNPDLDPNFTFPQAVPTLFTGQHTAIPRTDDDTKDPNFLQAI